MTFHRDLLGASETPAVRHEAATEIAATEIAATEIARLQAELTAPGERDAAPEPAVQEPTLQKRFADLEAANHLLQLEVAERRRAEVVARAQTLALSRALELLTSEPELDTFLSLILGVMGEHLKVDAVALWLYDGAADTLHFNRVYERNHGEINGEPGGNPNGEPGGNPNSEPDGNPNGEPGGRVFTGAQIGHASALLPVASRELPVWAEMNQTRAPVVVSDVARDPRMELYRRELAARNIETVLHVPLLLPAGAIGYLGAGTRRRQYSDEQLAVTQAMAHQMTVAIQLARLAGKQGRDAQAAAVLNERGRIARDIHDTLAQSLTAALRQAEAARGALDREIPDPHSALRHLSRVSALTSDALDEARRGVMALRPSRFEAEGDDSGSSLSAVLARLCDERTAQGPTRITFLQEGAPQPLSPALEEGLLRVAQESLSNLAKHAEASEAWLELAFAPDGVALRVQDNGLGLDPGAMRAFESRNDARCSDGSGFGLLGLRARAESLGGTLSLSSRVGQGTEVRVQVPLGVTPADDDAPPGHALYGNAPLDSEALDSAPLDSEALDSEALDSEALDSEALDSEKN